MTYFLTRRCSERRLFLRPDPAVRQVFEYLLGVCAKQYGIQIHAFVAMSNHYHVVLTDVRGVLPDFVRDFHSLLARSINAYRGRWESFWDPRPTSEVVLLGEDAVVQKMAYTLANPVKARLVERSREWGGATSAGMKFGRVRRIARPAKFFSASMPEVAELLLTRPPWGDDGLLDRVETLVGQLEVQHRALGRAMGMAKVLRQDWRDAPTTAEARRELSPTVAGADKEARTEWLRRTAEWLVEYRDALTAFVAGRRGVEFPSGTWWMCVRLGCAVAAGG